MKKKEILESLKRQVLEVQRELKVYEKGKKNIKNSQENSFHTKSTSRTDRFVNVNIQLSTNKKANKETKNFIQREDKFKNIA